MRLKRTALVWMTVFLLSSLAAANGLNLNSLGSRALAMGGAFVGLADDFSAAFWNPAGIAQFEENRFGFYGTDLIPSGAYLLEIPTPAGSFTLVDAETKTSHYLAGMGAYYHKIDEKTTGGIAVYTPSGLGAKWDGADFAPISNNQTYTWESMVGMVTISPALAYKLSDKVMAGAALNINYAFFDISTHAGVVEVPVSGGTTSVDLGQQEEFLSGWGYGATLGILAKPSSLFSLGAVFRTASRVSLEGEATIYNFDVLGVPETSDVSSEVTWPMWLGIGVAVLPIPKLTLTADIQYTNWGKIDVINFTFSNPIWKVAVQGTESAEMQMLWKDRTQLRFGGEYRFGSAAVRAGYYWDPSPAPDKTMNVLLPSFDFNVITAGFGYRSGGLQLDAGFEYLIGKDREVPLLVSGEMLGMPGKYSMTILVPNITLAYLW
ncbi:MAG: OmpP1/FadL family transporter [Candidatus Aminicenantaceae bacterium]